MEASSTVQANGDQLANGTLLPSNESSFAPSQTASEYVCHLYIMPYPLVSFWRRPRFIDTQLQLEADAREALPYVIPLVPVRQTWLTSCRPSTIAQILSGPFVKISSLAWPAIRHPIRPSNLTIPPVYAIRARSHVMASIPLLSCLVDETLPVIVEPAECHRPHHVRYGSTLKQASKAQSTLKSQPRPILITRISKIDFADAGRFTIHTRKRVRCFSAWGFQTSKMVDAGKIGGIPNVF